MLTHASSRSSNSTCFSAIRRSVRATALVAVLALPASAQAPVMPEDHGLPSLHSTGPLMTPSYVCVPDLRVALPASSRDLAQRQADVTRRQEELRLAQMGLSAFASVTAGADLGANLARSTDTTWATTMHMDAGVSFRHDAVAVTRAQSNLLTAQRREDAQRRTDVLNALLSLSRLRAAERAAAQTHGTAAAAEGLAESVRQSAATAHGSVLGADADVLLNIRELDLAAARARATASGRTSDTLAALAELARLGVTAGSSGSKPDQEHQGPADCLRSSQGPAFRASGPLLPLPTATATVERQLLVLAVQLATAQYQRASLAPLRDLSMTAHYQEGGARLLAEIDLAAGRPSAGLNFRLRDTNAHNWGVGVSATIRLDNTLSDSLAAARAQVEAAEWSLHEFDMAFDETLSNETADVHTAWLSLAFAIEALSIAQERLRLAFEEREAERAAQTVSRSVDALEREYQTYLRALSRYLAAFDLSWETLLDDGSWGQEDALDLIEGHETISHVL